MILESIILPALVPVISDGLRGLFAKIGLGAGASPQNVDERIKLMSAETDRLKALAELDAPNGSISPWVADLRGSFRYIAVGVIIFSTISGAFYGLQTGIMSTLLDMSGACMSFIIGERMYLKIKA